MKFVKQIAVITLLLAFIISFSACKTDNKITGVTTTTNILDANKGNDGITTTDVVTTDANGNTVTNSPKTNGTTRKNGTTTKNKATTKAQVKTTAKSTKPLTTGKLPYTTKKGSPTISPTEYKRKANPSREFLNGLKGFNFTEVTYWGAISKTDPIYYSSRSVEETVETRHGVNIKQKSMVTNYPQYISSELSSGEAPGNMCYARDSYFVNYFNSGFIQKLDKAAQTAKIDFKTPYYNQDVRKFFNIDGNQLGWAKSEGIGNNVVYYHKDLVKQVGLTDPSILAQKGQWTWEKLKEYARKLNKGSHKGLTVDGYTLVASMMASIGDNLVDMSGSKPIPKIGTANGKKCLNKAAEFAKTGAIDVGGASWDTGLRNWAQKKSVMIVSDSSALGYTDSKVNYDIGIVPFPKGTGYTGAYRNQHAISYIAFIPAGVGFSDLEVAKSLFIADELLRQSHRYWARDYWARYSKKLENNTLLNTGYNIENGLNGYKTVTNLVSTYETKSEKEGTYRICNDVMNLEKSPQQAIDTYSNTTKAQYDRFWGNNHKITGR